MRLLKFICILIIIPNICTAKLPKRAGFDYYVSKSSAVYRAKVLIKEKTGTNDSGCGDFIDLEVVDDISQHGELRFDKVYAPYPWMYKEGQDYILFVLKQSDYYAASKKMIEKATACNGGVQPDKVVIFTLKTKSSVKGDMVYVYSSVIIPETINRDDEDYVSYHEFLELLRSIVDKNKPNDPTNTATTSASDSDAGGNHPQ